jgi:hypothetical protein
MHFGILWGVDASMWGQCDMVKTVVKWAYSGLSIMHVLIERKTKNLNPYGWCI